jgi:hypothetical protein
VKEMVDRVAKAIHDRTLESDQDADYGLPMTDAIKCARAAIEALREPCPHAVAAAAGKLELPPYTVAGAWITMVDEVLK